MLKKITSFIILFTVLFILSKTFSTNVYAENEFIVDTNVDYNIGDTGITRVSHNTTLENAFPTIYATSYTLTLENIDPTDIKAYQGNKELITEEITKDNITLIKVYFDDNLIGKGKSRNFSINFNVDDVASRTGEVWEISIPRLSDESAFRDYTATIYVPADFGLESYISPDPLTRNESESSHVYTFNKDAIKDSPIQIGFGEFQVFVFKLSYHLENPLNEFAETTIPLPPDTAFQKVYYELISPEPSKTTRDADGNWIATYKLKPRERVDVHAHGSVQIFAAAHNSLTPTKRSLGNNLLGNEYWQVDSEIISSIASTLNGPKEIYDYVVDTLSYDYERVRPNVQRMGAKEALNNPSSAICMEFTDLFIALARASGIPAREINGYAYTENPEIQPLSLVSDVLHAWPEYWDEATSAWTPVDPTWGDTTNGLDYFDKLDLRHFTFVIHGEDPSKPYAPGSYKLGPNPQKDVYVNFGKLPTERSPDINLSASVSKNFPYLNTVVSLEVRNEGPTALYNTTPVLHTDGQTESLDTIDFLPPFSSKEVEVKIPFSFLGVNTPETIIIEVDSEKVEVPSYKSMVILNSLIMVFLSFSVIVVILLLVIRFRKRTKPTNEKTKKDIPEKPEENNKQERLPENSS